MSLPFHLSPDRDSQELPLLPSNMDFSTSFDQFHSTSANPSIDYFNPSSYPGSPPSLGGDRDPDVCSKISQDSTHLPLHTKQIDSTNSRHSSSCSINRSSSTTFTGNFPCLQDPIRTNTSSPGASSIVGEARAISITSSQIVQPTSFNPSCRSVSFSEVPLNPSTTTIPDKRPTQFHLRSATTSTPTIPSSPPSVAIMPEPLNIQYSRNVSQPLQMNPLPAAVSDDSEATTTLVGSPGWDTTSPYPEDTNTYGVQTAPMVPEEEEEEEKEEEEEEDDRAGRLNERTGLYQEQEHYHNHNHSPQPPRCGESKQAFENRFYKAPIDCHSKYDVKKRRRSWVFIITLTLSVISTVMSTLWMVVAFVQPRWGQTIMSSRRGHMTPETATFVCALLAKVIELSFVTVFVAIVGQILTTKAIHNGGSITLADMAVRNWVIQPGSILTHWEAFPRAAPTIIGFLTICATLAATFYTTASEVMISPKLKYGRWESSLLTGNIRASYGNADYARLTCATPLTNLDPGVDTMSGTDNGANTAGRSCLEIKYSGASYRNLGAWLEEWKGIHDQGMGTEIGAPSDNLMINRPVAKGMLFDNTTLTSQWIETKYANITAQVEKYRRMVNNVTLAMPHPGVYVASKHKNNRILQPDDLSGVGEYMIRASVVSPMLNTMCVDMTLDELKPLVWSLWEDNHVDSGSEALAEAANFSAATPYESQHRFTPTVVDEIFEWGANYSHLNPWGTVRKHPLFEVLPNDYNAVVDNDGSADSIYILTKPSNYTFKSPTNYTLCQIRSSLYLNCSTHFNISGISGAHLAALCDDPNDMDSYWKSLDGSDKPWMGFNADWHDLAAQWALALDIQAGLSDSNASNVRIWSQLATLPNWAGFSLNPVLPSMAEALAVLASSTLIIGSIDAPFKHYWEYPATSLDPGMLEYFNATLRTQEYTSGNTEAWHNVFYLVLVATVLLNLCCLLYIIYQTGMLTDFTEPQNMFALALNSPPSQLMNGSCGGGPGRKQLMVPFLVEYQEDFNHFYYRELDDEYAERMKGAKVKPVVIPGASYKELSEKRPMGLASLVGWRRRKSAGKLEAVKGCEEGV